jgi:hypothetical protein
VRLAQVLSDTHKIRLSSALNGAGSDKRLGAAMFFAFDPWNTCLRMPPSSFGYFSAAERAQLIDGNETLKLLQLLLDIGATVSSRYQGCFAPYFREHKVRVIFQHAGQLSHLADAGLAFGPDVLFSGCPWPILPEYHLQAKSFQFIKYERDFHQYLNPWSAWIEALDAICLGPWVGLKAGQIAQILEALHPEKTQIPLFGDDGNGLVTRGRRISLPFFVNGFQGIVTGFFAELDAHGEAAVTTTLLQFGQTLADIYFDLRSRHFLERARHANNQLDALARALVSLLSPIELLVIQSGSLRHGYQLLREHGYWAGFASMDDAAITLALASKRGFQIQLPADFDATLFVEPVNASIAIDAELAKMSLQNCLAKHFAQLSRAPAAAGLSLTDVDRARAELENTLENGQPSLAKLRLIYVLDKVAKSWTAGKVQINNYEMKRYLMGKLNREVKNGYQITSYTDDIRKQFQGRLTVEKSRSGVLLQWRT